MARTVTSPPTPTMPIKSEKAIGENLRDFLEHGWVIAALSTVGTLVGFLYTPVLILCGIAILLAFHRVGVVRGKSWVIQTVAYGVLFAATTSLLYGASAAIKSNLPHVPTASEIADAVMSAFARQGPKHVYDLIGDRRTKFEESLKKQTEPKAPVRVGCDDQSEQSCLAAGRFLLAISEAEWKIDSNRVFRMQQLIPKEGITVAWNDRNAEKYKNLPPHQGFWHPMSPSELTFYWAFRGMDIPVNGVNDPSLPEGTIGIYVGPEPQK